MKAAATLFAVCVLVLTLCGITVLYSVTSAGESWRFLSRQLAGGALGVALACVIAFGTRYEWLPKVAWALLALSVVLLVLVLVPGLGVKVNGARRWFRLAGVQFQPSDFAKLALLMALARYAADARGRMGRLDRGMLVPGLMIGVVLGLIFLEPDWGTALMLGAVCAVVLLVSGVRWSHFLPPVIAAVALVAGMLALNPTRSDRVYSWLHVEETRHDTGHQVWQSWIALGSGGVTGVGFDQSTQKRFVPEAHTDFIFAIVGEEFGFVGVMTVVALFATLFCCGWFIAWNAPDPFGTYLATGVTFLIGLQALFNIAVVSGALPNKGLSLPFISYGGSNLLMLLICSGVLLRVARAAVEPARDGATGGALGGVPLTRLA